MDREKIIQFKITIEKIQVILYYLWTISIFFSWRITIGTLSSGKSIDFRIDDFFIFGVEFLFFILLTLKKIKFFITPIEKILFIWIIYKLFITIFSLLQLFSVSKAFYLLKELEFYFLILIFPSFARLIKLDIIIKIIIITGFATGSFILWQIFTGNLLGVEYGYYGISIIGEYSPLDSGLILAFYSIFFYFFL